MPWYQSWGSSFADQTSNDEWKKVMGHENVITLDEMPGWDKYTDVEEALAENGVAVYPNPVKDNLMIVADNASVKVMDIAGRVIASAAVNGTSSISTSAWMKGVYTVIVSSENGENFFKIVK